MIFEFITDQLCSSGIIELRGNHSLDFSIEKWSFFTKKPSKSTAYIHTLIQNFLIFDRLSSAIRIEDMLEHPFIQFLLLKMLMGIGGSTCIDSNTLLKKIVFSFGGNFL